jgi:hypothetical protein
MAQTTPDLSEMETEAPMVEVRQIIRGVTWRFLGDRTAADHAYCVRFNVSHAPQPLVAPDGAWAYALPAVKPPR